MVGVSASFVGLAYVSGPTQGGRFVCYEWAQYPPWGEVSYLVGTVRAASMTSGGGQGVHICLPWLRVRGWVTVKGLDSLTLGDGLLLIEVHRGGSGGVVC